MNFNLNAWLTTTDNALMNALVADIKDHVQSVLATGATIYGYSVLPSDYRTCVDPDTLAIAFNGEADISAKHAGSSYYRYSVDEWKNYVRSGFERSNLCLKSMLEKFRIAHTREPRSTHLDDYEIAFIEKINRSILAALLDLKSSKFFSDEVFLVIWYSDSHDDIIFESARALNSDLVFRAFASEFI